VREDLLLAVPSGAGTAVRYAWEIDPGGEWEYHVTDGGEWYGWGSLSGGATMIIRCWARFS
jgi:hypothetical protein